jgi:hypothetical protein
LKNGAENIKSTFYIESRSYSTISISLRKIGIVVKNDKLEKIISAPFFSSLQILHKGKIAANENLYRVATKEM